MNPDTVKNYFENTEVVADYLRAVEEVGLWNSERAIFEKYFKNDFRLLELGCGAGRISVNLAISGYANLCATDFSENMVNAARQICTAKNLPVDCRVCDALDIPFAESSFDGAIFGFNGLMQIPMRKNRIAAMRNILRVLRTSGIFIFTTHDRDAERNATYWESESKQWRTNSQQPILDEFGDIYYKGAHGSIYIHSPSREEIAKDLNESGFEIVESLKRSEICPENAAAEDFSDDCIFWVARKPDILPKTAYADS